MPYSAFTLLALLLHIVLNISTFRKRKPNEIQPATNPYRLFLASVAVFFLTDLLWGIFEENKLAVPLYVDTIFYFIFMGLTMLFWNRFIVVYLNGNKVIGKIIVWAGVAFFLAEIVLLIVNIWTPILFRVDFETCKYISFEARNWMLNVQVILFLLKAIYTIVIIFRYNTANPKIRNRYIVVSFCCLIMAGFIIAQIFDAYLPLYTIGVLLSIALLNVFVVDATRQDYKEALRKAELIRLAKEDELGSAISIANTDTLTGAKNRHAYVETEFEYDQIISTKVVKDFAIVVFDLNGLKFINDHFGHDAGDRYIVDSVQTIKRYFPGKELYRFGGDEFVYILLGDEFKKAEQILANFNSYINECLGTSKPIIAAGLAAYIKEQDNTFRAVFKRADKAMYERKQILKSQK